MSAGRKASRAPDGGSAVPSDADGSGGSREAGGSGITQIVAVVVGLGLLGAGWWMSREQAFTILVVSLDTTRADHLTPYGHSRDTSPLLARLAREGTLFTNARTTAPWTLPSHMSLFTGLPHDLHDVTIDFQVLDLARPTLGTVFKDAGFHTAGFYTAPYVHPRYGFARGFDFYERCTQEPMAFDLTGEQVEAERGLRELISHREVTSRRVARQAVTRMVSSRSERSLYFLHFFDPHYDYRAPPEIQRQFVDPSYSGPITGEDIMQRPELLHADMPEADLQALLSHYDAEIRWVDQNLETVMKTVEKRGAPGRTLVVVVSDHGEEFFEAGKFGHRMTLRDEALRIPMIFWGPGLVPAGRVVEDDVTLYDVLPTLMDYADIPGSEALYGRSLRPLIDGGRLPPRPATAALTFLHHDGPDYYTRHDALVYDGMKYVRRVRVPWSRDEATIINHPPLLETAEIDVFDLRADPLEKHDLYDANPNDPRCLALLRVVEDEESRQRAFLSELPRHGVPRPTMHAFDPALDVLEAIKQMGYASAVDVANQGADAGPPAGGERGGERGDDDADADADDDAAPPVPPDDEAPSSDGSGGQ